MNQIKSHSSRIVIVLCMLLSGCLNTEGDLEIGGRVKDETTNEDLPGRNIIIQALQNIDGNDMKIEAGQFTTDSSGKFRYTLKKIKDARYYNFIVVGDSDYALKTRTLGLYEVEQNAKFLSFSLSKMTGLSIIINRKTKEPVFDTLSLAWDSNNVYYWSFPFRVTNYDETNHITIASAGSELRWYGGDVNSIVKTRVFAGKKTKIYWDLRRSGKKMEFTDTITCMRDVDNKVYFTY